MRGEHLARLLFYRFFFGKVPADHALDPGENCRVVPFRLNQLLCAIIFEKQFRELIELVLFDFHPVENPVDNLPTASAQAGRRSESDNFYRCCRPMSTRRIDPTGGFDLPWMRKFACESKGFLS